MKPRFLPPSREEVITTEHLFTIHPRNMFLFARRAFSFTIHRLLGTAHFQSTDSRTAFCYISHNLQHQQSFAIHCELQMRWIVNEVNCKWVLCIYIYSDVYKDLVLFFRTKMARYRHHGHARSSPSHTAKIWVKSIVFVGPGPKNEALTPKIEASGPANKYLFVFLWIHVRKCARFDSKSSSTWL